MISKRLTRNKLYYYKQDFEEAIKFYDRILNENPNYVDALTNKGVALGALGNHKDSIALCNKAIEINPKNVNALTNKGVSLGYIRKYNEAIEWLNKALNLDPHNQVLLKYKEFVEEKLKL